MSGPDSVADASGDYARRAGLCVEVLGWLTLLRLDLLGLVLIKAGRGVRARNRRWWKVAVGLWGLHLAAWVVIGAVAMITGGRVSLFGKSWGVTLAPWMFLLFGFLGVALVVPYLWLLAPATRQAMARAPALSQMPLLAYSSGNQGANHEDSTIGRDGDVADCNHHARPGTGSV